MAKLDMLDLQAEAAVASPDRWAVTRLIAQDFFARMGADGDVPDSFFDEWTLRMARVRRTPVAGGIN